MVTLYLIFFFIHIKQNFYPETGKEMKKYFVSFPSSHYKIYVYYLWDN